MTYNELMTRLKGLVEAWEARGGSSAATLDSDLATVGALADLFKEWRANDTN